MRLQLNSCTWHFFTPRGVHKREAAAGRRPDPVLPRITVLGAQRQCPAHPYLVSFLPAAAAPSRFAGFQITAWNQSVLTLFISFPWVYEFTFISTELHLIAFSPLIRFFTATLLPGFAVINNSLSQVSSLAFQFQQHWWISPQSCLTL